MIELPQCRWRGVPTIEGHHRCRSFKLRHGPNGVCDKLCATCHVRNHSWLQLRFVVELFRAMRRKTQRLRRFAASAARHVLRGFPRACAADVAARRSVCGPCMWRDRETDTCTQCGCHLGGRKDLIAKLAWAGEKCPLYDPVTKPGEYWGPVQGSTIWRRAFRRVLRLLRP